MYSLRRIPSLFIIALLAIVSSCQLEKSKNIDTPENYEFLRDNISTVDFLGQSTRLKMAEELIALVGVFDGDKAKALEMFRNESVDGNDVNPFIDAELNSSTKSISSKVAASVDLFFANTVESAEIKTKLESFIENQYDEVVPLTSTLASEGKAGQLADGSTARYFNSKGMENNQLLAKSLIGSLILDQIINNYLSPSVLDEASNTLDNDLAITVTDRPYTNMEHKWDEAYGYLFGRSTSPEDPLQNLGEGIFLNNYLSSVNDDNDFKGIATEIFEAFKLGRAAIVAGEYDIRDEQVTILKKGLSKIIGIRAVYYLQTAKKHLTSENYGSAFHSLSEGYGFIYSLRFTRTEIGNTALFSKEEIDGYIGILENDNGFWNTSIQDLDILSQDIADKFDFTIAQAAE